MLTKIVIQRREPFAEGYEFPITGAYEKLVGKVYGEVDPKNTLNKVIVNVAAHIHGLENIKVGRIFHAPLSKARICFPPRFGGSKKILPLIVEKSQAGVAHGNTAFCGGALRRSAEYPAERYSSECPGGSSWLWRRRTPDGNEARRATHRDGKATTAASYITATRNSPTSAKKKRHAKRQEIRAGNSCQPLGQQICGRR